MNEINCNFIHKLSFGSCETDLIALMNAELSFVKSTTNNDIIIIDPCVECKEMVRQLNGANISILEILGYFDKIVFEKLKNNNNFDEVFDILNISIGIFLDKETSPKQKSIIYESLQEMIKDNKENNIKYLITYLQRNNCDAELSFAFTKFLETFSSFPKNEETLIKLENQIVRFDFSTCEESVLIKKLAYFFALIIAKNKIMKNAQKRKYTLLMGKIETKNSLESQGVKEYLTKIYRIMRPYYGISSFYLNNFSMLFQDEVFFNLLHNTDSYVFLSQKEIDRDYIKQYLNVPPKYLKYIKEGQACCKGIHISKDECNLFIFKR